MTALVLPARATLEQAPTLLRSVEAALATGGDGVLQVDASALIELDTSAVALLLQARRLAQDRGRGFELIAAPAKLVALAKLYGVDSLLSMPDGPSAETGPRTVSA